jgi:glycosyltransferase involved in cell wall biosynthesis
MQAHQKLRTKHPDLLLVLVGRLGGKNGPPLLINKEWAQKQDFEGIIYTDFIPDSEMLWLLRHCQAYVFPSLMEGFGLPGLEAMIAGAPLVSSNATVMPEVYQDGAYYFDPTSIEDMTQKIDDVLSNTQLRTRLIKRSQEIVRTYSWKRMATQTHEVYMKALQKKN